MATDETSDFEFLTASARRSITNLRTTLERVPRAPGERGSHFLSVISATLDALEAAVSARESEFATSTDDTDRRAIVVAARQLNIYIMSLHSVAPDIESAAQPPLALGFIYFVDQLVTLLLRQRADVVMMPGLRYNYSTGFRPYEDLLQDLGVTVYPVSVPPIVVRFPIQETDSLFLHLIVAHELGHHVVEQERLDAQVMQQDPTPSANLASFTQAVADYQSINRVSAVRAHGEIARRFASWLSEFLCDAIGLAIIGPSYLLTFAAFITPVAGPEPGPSHPPAMLRMELLMNLLDAWGWRTLLDPELSSTMKWMDETAGRGQQVGQNTYYLSLEEIFERLFGTIRAVVETSLGSRRYSHDGYETQAAELRLLLANDVLPAQLEDRSAAHHRNIILAGWLHALARYQDEPTSLVRVVADRDYQRFLTKALEMSAVLETWLSL